MKYLVSLTVFTRKVLFEPGPIQALQCTLQRRWEAWCADTWLVRFERRTERIDFSDTDALYRVSCREAIENRIGFAHFRDAKGRAYLYLSLDHQPLGSWYYGNRARVQINRKRVQSVPYADWCRAFLGDLITHPAFEVDYGSIKLDAESESKNVDRTGGGWRGIGPKNLALPGLYWANFLGAPYCDLIGRDRLLSAPAYEVKEVGSGVLLLLGEKPEDWDAPDYKLREQRVLDHIGREYVFERDNPDKPTKGPFNLPPAPPHDPANDIHVLHAGGGQYEVLNPELREKLGLPPLDPETLRRFGFDAGS